MTTKFGKQVHLQDLAQTRQIKQVLVTSLRQDHVTNDKHISTTRVPMATKLGRMLAYLDGLLPIKSHDPLIKWSCEIPWQTKAILSLSTTTISKASTTAKPMSTKLDRMVTYLEWLLHIKSHGFLITWSCKITWQPKIVIYTLTQCLWL